MLIISPKFNDYYDQIVHVFGVDRKIVFDRTKKLPKVVVQHIADEHPLTIENLLRHSWVRRDSALIEESAKQFISRFLLLSICGRPFYVGVVERAGSSTYLVLPNGGLEYELWGRRQSERGQTMRYLLKLHKYVGAPLLMMEDISYVGSTKSQGTYQFRIQEDIPRLADIRGLATTYGKEQAYQDISYWIANLKDGSPDAAPTGNPEQTDHEKVVSHGLDLRYGFRHRGSRK